MATPTTTSQLSSGSSALYSPQTSTTDEIKSQTGDILANYFPALSNVPDMVKYCMVTWYSESTYRQFPYEADSRHPAIVCGSLNSITNNGNYADPIYNIRAWVAGRGFYNSYWADNVVRNYINNNGAVDESIIDGLHPHGLGGVMGAYSVRGTAACNQIFGSPDYYNLASTNGLIVSPGTRVTSIYTDDTTGHYRNLLAGIIILDYHFNNLVGADVSQPISRGSTATIANTYYAITNQNISSETVQVNEAALLATGAYVGYSGVDINGMNGVKRASDCWTLDFNKLIAAWGKQQPINSSTYITNKINPYGCS